MPSYPNQKTAVIHKEKVVSDFMQIPNKHWMKVNQDLGPFALQVYLYLAKNANGYSFALSQEAAEQEAGIKKTSFHKYVNLLIAEGYLVQRSGNLYDFYETPRERSELRSSPHDGLPSPHDEQQNPQDDLICPQVNKEIDNREINIIDNSIDTLSETHETREIHILMPKGEGEYRPKLQEKIKPFAEFDAEEVKTIANFSF